MQPALSVHLCAPLLAKEPRGPGQSRGAIPRMLGPSGLCFSAYDRRACVRVVLLVQGLSSSCPATLSSHCCINEASHVTCESRSAATSSGARPPARACLLPESLCLSPLTS